MSLFEWRGRSVIGEIRKGVLEAPNSQLVEVYLRRLNIVPLKIQLKKESSLKFERKSVSDKELALFTRQFATMLEAGLPIVKSLNTLAMQQKNSYFKKVILDIKTRVEGGSTLSEALSEYPKVFPNLYIQMVRSGESAGNLDEVLKRLADYLEKIVSLKAKIRHAMVYPFLIVFVTIVVISIIMMFVIPKYSQFFTEAGQSLPTPTLFLLKVSKNFKKIAGFTLLGIIFFVVFIKLYRSNEKGRYNTDKILLNLPILGNLFHKVAIARFARTFSTLLSSGVLLLQALSMAGSTAGNMVIQRAVEEVRINVSAGHNLAEPMFYSGVFPSLFVEMVRVGETAGNLEELLDKVADFYEEEVDRAVNTLSSLIEPILLIILGVIIGGILIALYLPIFQLGGVVGG